MRGEIVAEQVSRYGLTEKQARSILVETMVPRGTLIRDLIVISTKAAQGYEITVRAVMRSYRKNRYLVETPEQLQALYELKEVPGNRSMLMMTNKDELLRWYTGNVRLRNDFRDRDKENWMPVKRNRYRKIDGFMACLDAHTVAMQRAPIEPDVEPSISVYSLF